MCEVISCGDAHPRVSGGWLLLLLLLLTSLAVVTARETEGAVDGSVVDLGEAWQAAGEVVGGAGIGVRRWQTWTVTAALAEGSRGQGALILH